MKDNNIIKDILKNEVIERHSYFQLKNFLIGKEPTVQSRLWRCVREIKIRQDSIDSINLETEDIKDDIELMLIKIKDLTSNNSESDSSIRNIKIRKLNRKIHSFEKRMYDLTQKLKNLVEECDFLANCFYELEKTEKLKTFDDQEEQQKYWDSKLQEELNIKLFTGVPLDSELVKTIFSLDKSSKVKNNLISIINKRLEANKLEHLNDI